MEKIAEKQVCNKNENSTLEGGSRDRFTPFEKPSCFTEQSKQGPQVHIYQSENSSDLGKFFLIKMALRCPHHQISNEMRILADGCRDNFTPLDQPTDITDWKIKEGETFCENIYYIRIRLPEWFEFKLGQI